MFWLLLLFIMTTTDLKNMTKVIDDRAVSLPEDTEQPPGRDGGP